MRSSLSVAAAAPDGVSVLPLDSLMSPVADRSVAGVVGCPFFRERVVGLEVGGVRERVRPLADARLSEP